MADKKYIGQGKLHEFNDGGSVINGIVFLDFDDNDVQTAKSGREFVKISVSERSTPDEYGNTHYITLDDFKPDKSKSREKSNGNTSSKRTTKPSRVRRGDEVPF